MSGVPEPVRRSAEVEPDESELRLDQLCARRWPEFSRSRLTAWIREGAVTVDGRPAKPNLRVRPGQRICVDAALERHATNPEPQSIEIPLLFQDEHVLVVDKPAGLVVHPGSGNRDRTLVNGLLALDPGLEALPRAGLVHRLDKDTSGCLVVARTTAAHAALVAALKRREIHRHYLALVWGQVIAGGRIDQPLGRHPVDRRRQVVRPDGRRAVTHYRVARRLAGATLLDVELDTGRTHQIRVHMQHAGYPLVGDPVYGRRGAPGGLDPDQRAAWQGFPRQALHAVRLEFPHPVNGSTIRVESPLPADLRDLIELLDHDD